MVFVVVVVVTAFELPSPSELPEVAVVEVAAGVAVAPTAEVVERGTAGVLLGVLFADCGCDGVTVVALCCWVDIPSEYLHVIQGMN